MVNEMANAVHIDKCKAMHHGKNNYNYTYNMDNTLCQTSQEKVLEILITSELKASQQFTQTYSKANKLLGVINRSIVYKSPEVMLKLYKPVPRPHLEYCISAIQH